MHSRNLLNLFMLLMLIALAVTAWFVYRDKSAITRLSSLEIAQVNNIVIPREHDDIVLSKNGSTWRMEKPYALMAHDFRVQTLLGLLQTQVTQSYNSSELDLEQLGLNPPRASIRFNNTEIKFGKSNPVNNKRYILSDDQIYLIEDKLYPLVSAEAASLVNLSLLEPAAIIESISLPAITLTKAANNIWHDNHGKTIAADTAQQLIDNWRDASAFAVHAYMARAHSKPVTLELNNKNILHFMVSQEKDWLIIGRPDIGVEFHLDVNYADKLLKLPTSNKQPDHA